jgi:hypothetical protein
VFVGIKEEKSITRLVEVTPVIITGLAEKSAAVEY